MVRRLTKRIGIQELFSGSLANGRIVSPPHSIDLCLSLCSSRFFFVFQKIESFIKFIAFGMHLFWVQCSWIQPFQIQQLALVLYFEFKSSAMQFFEIEWFYQVDNSKFNFLNFNLFGFYSLKMYLFLMWPFQFQSFIIQFLWI